MLGTAIRVVILKLLQKLREGKSSRYHLLASFLPPSLLSTGAASSVTCKDYTEMIENFAPRRGGTASFVILPRSISRLDVRTSRNVGVATAELCAVYQLSACASGSCQPGGAAQLLASSATKQPAGMTHSD